MVRCLLLLLLFWNSLSTFWGKFSLKRQEEWVSFPSSTCCANHETRSGAIVELSLKGPHLPALETLYFVIHKWWENGLLWVKENDIGSKTASRKMTYYLFEELRPLKFSRSTFYVNFLSEKLSDPTIYRKSTFKKPDTLLRSKYLKYQ